MEQQQQENRSEEQRPSLKSPVGSADEEIYVTGSKSIILLSGGLDSAVALYWAIEHGLGIETLTFDYFRRNPKEIQAGLELSRRANCPNTRLELNFLKELDDLKTAELKNPLLEGVESAYIPSRNMIFYGIASSIAEIIDAKYIVGGHNKNDATTFPDSSESFFEAFNKVASMGRISGSRTGKVLLPFAKLDKSEVIRIGVELSVPFELTWSCYENRNVPCSKCYSCLLRSEAFAMAGVKDPLTP